MSIRHEHKGRRPPNTERADKGSNPLPAVSEEALAKRLAKEQQRREGEDAMVEYKARQRATQRKTSRLRVLRLARDSAATETARSKKKKPS
jgi:hypothetical protein